jgi:hypothetical protein
MATKLQDFEPLPQGRPPDYPWDQWLNGETWEIVHGVDFTCTMNSMETSIRRTAAKSLLKDAKGKEYRISVHRKDAKTFVITRRKE